MKLVSKLQNGNMTRQQTTQANESPECRKKRLAMQRKTKAQTVENETPESTAARLSKQIQYNRQRLENETPECRAERLAKKQE
jgi:hypothetical protein